MNSYFRLLIFLGLTTFLFGCTPDGPELGEVTGVIKLDGEPVEGAYVSYSPLFPDGIELNAAGPTDAEGRYEMQYSIKRNGVLLGPHRVTVSTLDDIKMPDGRNKKIPERIPVIYRNEKSPLEITVKAGKNDGSFDLSSDEK